jgi:type VI secretion system protein ImpH
MASENRTSAHVLIRDLQADVYRYDFFEALRWLEALHPDKPRLGTGLKASDDVVRLSQEPDLQFPASTLAACETGDASLPRLAVNFFGLFGPNGPLPLHLTEYARERLRNHHDSTLARFADIFHHRMLSLFYRAWADTRPTVNYDRPDEDRFAFYIGSLMGLGGQTFHRRDAFDDRGKFFYSGLFSGQTKSPDSLRAIVADVMSMPVRIEEFVGEWMEIQQSDHSRLGYIPELATLGQSTLLGAFVWGCQHKFRVVLGPLNLSQYLSLLPGGSCLTILAAIVRNYIGDELVWDAQLILSKEEVPAELVLGTSKQSSHAGAAAESRLGWSMWLGPRPSQEDADDLTLNPFFVANTIT